MTTRSDPTEAQVQRACLDWLNTLPGVRVWRQNRGAFAGEYTSKRTGRTKKRFVQFGESGMADLSGIGPQGIRIEVEIKRMGEEPTPDQFAWLDFCRKAGAIAFWCWSLDDCIDQARDCFLERRIPWQNSWEV